MIKEKREILEHLIEYLQDKIDNGYHKIFYNDDMYDEKTIDCINAINDTIEENIRLNNIIKEVREYITSYESISIMQGLMKEYSNYDLDVKTMNEMIRRYMIVHDKILEILDKGE